MQRASNTSCPGSGAVLGPAFVRACVRFAHKLREAGIAAGPDRPAALARALALVGAGNREDFRASARAIFAKNRDQFRAFDELFDAFWLEESGRAPTPGFEGFVTRSDGPETGERAVTAVIYAGDREDPQADHAVSGMETRAVIAAFSPDEVLRRKDFEALTPEELSDVDRLMASMRWELAQRKSRRQRPHPKAGRLDPRRAMRATLRHGGDGPALAWRARKTKPRGLVVICDVSGSMERYTRMLLAFGHCLQRGLRGVEVFVFGTRLTRITRQLRGRGIDGALRRVAAVVDDWSGGTRIGASLHQFNRAWARRTLGRGAVVMLVSDGWDRGSPEVLVGEMRYLKRSAYRLIWLNPLLGQPGYEPLTAGLAAALPYVDDFLPVHNLESLERLGGLLAAIPGGRTPRARPSGLQRSDRRI